MKDALLILTGYVLGSMPWGYWLPRILRGVNIRTVGSGSRELRAPSSQHRPAAEPQREPVRASSGFEGQGRRLVVWPVTLPASWVASTKPEAAIARRQGLQP